MRRIVLILALASPSITIAEENELTLKAEVKAPASNKIGQVVQPQVQEIAPTVEAAPTSSSNPSASPAQPTADQGKVSFANQICKNGQHTRRVELTGAAPCEVHYKKESEQPGHDQVLWTSPNNQSYCVAKAQTFVEKLVSMGWACSAS